MAPSGACLPHLVAKTSHAKVSPMSGACAASNRTDDRTARRVRGAKPRACRPASASWVIAGPSISAAFAGPTRFQSGSSPGLLPHVPPEVGVQALVGVEAEELADDLDRQHLAVREDRCRAALAQPTLAAQVADEVVHDAEHDDDEGLQVHGRGPRGCPATDQPP